MEAPQRKKNEPIPFAKGTPEYDEEVKRRARENWAKKKHIYRPKEELKAPGEEPPKPKNLPITWAVPADLQESLGTTIVLPAEWQTWPMYHVRRQSELSKTTMAQYKSYYYKLPQKDIFDTVRFINTQPNAQANMYAKSGLSYVCQGLYESIYERHRKGLANSGAYRTELQKMMVFSALNKKTKKVSYEQHTSQEASDERLANTVPWDDWKELAKRFVRIQLTKKEPTARDKQEALVAALYSMLPPVRLDWNDVQVRRSKGGKALGAQKGEAGKNILYMSPTGAVMFWGEFKNADSFKDELPLKQEIPKDLYNVLKKTLPDGDSEPLKLPNFSTFLTTLANHITGKHFSNRLMRSSYIRWWHDNNSQNGVDVAKTRAMMRQLHQSNLEVHLAYDKTKCITNQMIE
jgi:hypothetical protein